MIEQTLAQLPNAFHLHGFEVLIVVVVFAMIACLYFRFNQQLKKLIQDAPTPLLLVDAKSGALLLSNAFATQVLGVRRVGRSFLLPEVLPSSFINNLIQQFSGSGFAGYQIDWAVSASKTIKVEVTGRQTRYRGRSVWLLYVTPYKSSTVEVLAEMQSLSVVKSAFDSLSELIFIKKQDDSVVSNRAFDRFWAERAEEGYSAIEGVMKGRASTRRWTVDPQGRSCLLETHQSLLMSTQGEPLGMLGISHDVTDWHNMQQSLRDEMERRKDTEVALAQRDTILQNILESSPDSIGIFNENMVYQACNEPFVKGMGISDVDDLIGKRLQDVIPNEVYERLSDSDRKVLNEGVSLRYIDQVIHSNGEITWYDVVKSPFRDPASGTNGVLVMARDVSERYLAEQKLEAANQELERLSFIDGLTQISNRRRFDEQLDTLWHLHVREKQPLTVMMCDIDDFKGYNDHYGHQKGDEALIAVAQAFRRVASRSSDCVARYGGEEFGFILPNTMADGAQLLAERIHAEVARLAIPHQSSRVTTHITVSIGVISLKPHNYDDAEAMVALADSALYQAKANGRNQTCVHHTSEN
ncbi:sensory box/GGDEF family protein [Vibrio ichthyoenteri ATCC 700023]|uniref:diguanylate cyclase n=1 Tax=Vibrio ichthyoenteri ATCC 700023 TaxID=870968 RepID=F9S081_9VIBR|nr:GGDEF domain-containing protein [Vibrio ichthyoenteri]EGU43571.1 sensory box/GGDEF family protein [Vibrio ichthyoenteri ATCC 700023]